LVVNADGGGSNGSRVRLWEISLQEFANEINIPITVCHCPHAKNYSLLLSSGPRVRLAPLAAAGL
jgi:hypothetical protein